MNHNKMKYRSSKIVRSALDGVNGALVMRMMMPNYSVERVEAELRECYAFCNALSITSKSRTVSPRFGDGTLAAYHDYNTNSAVVTCMLLSGRK
jgi:hypothetical protein